MRELAPDFKQTFEALLGVMTLQEDKLKKRQEREAKEAAHPALITISSPTFSPTSSTIITTSQKRTRPSAVTSIPEKRPKTEEDAGIPKQPTTPDQLTKPANPDHTSSSAESKEEPNTRGLLEAFIGETISVLKKDFNLIRWQRSGHKVQIAKTYVTLGILNLTVAAVTR